MNPSKIAEMLNELRMLPYFPDDEYVLVGLTRLVGEMASSEDQVRWLVSRMTSGLYERWPGPREMRACFCSKFKPRDGISIYSAVYLDGIPSEKPKLAEPQRIALPAGSVTADPQLDAAVKRLAAAKSLNRGSR